MAYAMTKQGSLDNCVTYEFICDTIADMNAIENRYRTIGSVAVVLTGEGGGMEAYITGSNKQWNNLGSLGASGSGSSSSTGGLSIHICAQNEVSDGKPNIASPDETTIYLVSAGNESGNLYEEYIYVNSTWEKFGAASIDISGKADKTDTVLSTTLSRGRKSNTTVGTGSFAFGSDVEASGIYSHVEGSVSKATNRFAHAEGVATTASGECSHAEGYQTQASGEYSHSEGNHTLASGANSHTEGFQTIASGVNAHAEGDRTKAEGINAHAEGQSTQAGGISSHAEGQGGTYTLNGTTYESKAVGVADHTEGYQCLTANGQPGNHAEGYQTRATGGAAHTEGSGTIASGNSSHAEGNTTIASGYTAHTEGYNTTASGTYCHAEGNGTSATGTTSHAEGEGTSATGSTSHAEGDYTTALGNISHAEGSATIASGAVSHAEGYSTVAAGNVSHAEGLGTKSTSEYSHVSGTYNIIDSYANWNEWVANTSYTVGDKVKRTTTVNNVESSTGYICKTANNDSTFDTSKWTRTGKMNYVEIIGNGSADDARSNARALDWDGNERLKGDLYVGCNSDSTGGNKVATEAFVTTRVPAPPVADGTYILQVSVSSGTPTYSWVSLSDLSGVTF